MCFALYVNKDNELDRGKGELDAKISDVKYKFWQTQLHGECDAMGFQSTFIILQLINNAMYVNIFIFCISFKYCMSQKIMVSSAFFGG